MELFKHLGEVMQTEKNWTDWSATVVVITRDSHNSRVLEKVFNQTFPCVKEVLEFCNQTLKMVLSQILTCTKTKISGPGKPYAFSQAEESSY